MCADGGADLGSRRFPYNPGLKSTLIESLIAAEVYGAEKTFQIKHL